MADTWEHGKIYARPAEVDGEYKLLTCLIRADDDEPYFDEWKTVDGSTLRFSSVKAATEEVRRRKREQEQVKQNATAAAIEADTEIKI